ncbi:MAG: immunoglobulin-like domain-containing protein [Bacteroidia bacterium]
MKKVFYITFIILFAKISYSQTITIGTQQNSTGANGTFNPYGAWYTTNRVQFLITASELQAALGFGGQINITSIGFNILALTTGGTCPSSGEHLNFTIRLKNTNVSEISGTNPFDNSGFTTVFGPITFVVNTTGWTQHNFSTQFAWDGSSNLLVDMCHDNSTFSSACYSWSPDVATMTTNLNQAGYRWADGSGSYCNTTLTPLVSNRRPIMRFTYTSTGGPTLPPIANFFPSQPNTLSTPIDTIWLNSPYTLVSTSQNASRTYWDLPNVTNLPFGYFRQSLPFTTQQYIDTLKYNRTFTYTFNQRGFHPVRLLAVNYLKIDSLRDSVVRFVFVDTPSRVPKTDFISFKRKVGFGDFANMLDLSSYGPNQWLWSFDPPCNKCQVNPFFNNFFAGPTDQNPLFFGGDPGKYTVCLQTWNARGWDSVCKPNYMEVLNSYSICSGSGATFTTDNEGYLFGPAGPGLSYTRSQLTGCTGIVIAPCADSITFYVERIKMLPTDSLEIRNGNNPAAPLVARIGGNGLQNIPVQFRNGIRVGRVAHVRIVPGTGTVPNPYDSAGFNIRWDILPPTYPKPIARFDIPDTIYSNMPVTFRSRAIGSLIEHSWDSDGNGIFDSTRGQFIRSFFITTPQVRNICYVAYNCVGSDTVCKAVVFLPTTQKPVARFSVDKTIGFNIDTFYFKDISLNGPAQWTWSFTPGSIQYLNGTGPNSQFPDVRFTQRTRYTVKLVVRNAIGADSITEVNYINIGAYDIPISITPINQADGSIGISRVIVQTGIDTATNAFTPDYQFVQGTQLGQMYRGSKHAVTVVRPGNTAPMDRKVWIDFNMDGNFDNNELIMNETGSTAISRTDTVVVSPTQRLGTTRMRVGVTLAGTALNPALAFLGVFRDYNISFPQDTVRPIIALNGAAVMNTEINKPYIEPGITAIDNIEGNISHKMEVFGSVNVNTVGPNQLKYIVRDLYGNVSDTVYRTVFVVLNQTGPTITLNGSSIQYVEVYNKFVEPGWVARDNANNDISNQVIVSGFVDTASLGSYTLRYRVIDAFGLSQTVNRLVNVGDTTRPVISPRYAQGQNYYEHQIGRVFDILDAVSITDNYWPLQNLDIEVAGTVDVNNQGTYILRYRARDPRGNIANEVFVNVVVIDRVAPAITLRGLADMTWDVFEPFTDPGVNVTDNYWPVNTILVQVRGNVNTSKLGTYTLWYVATDPSGNKDSISRIVTVVDRQAPTIQIIGSTPFNLPRWREFVDPGVSLIDNYDTEADLRPRLITVNTLPLNAQGNPFGDYPGLFAVKYRVTDLSGNESEEVIRVINVLQANNVNEVINISTIMSVYPNPAHDVLNFRLVNSMSENITASLIDMQGKEIFSRILDIKTTAQQSVSLEGISKGVYMLKVTTSDKVYTHKVQVN